MEEDKIQKLHDSLSKLRKGKGLGTNSHYNFGGNLNNNNGIPLKEDKDGKLYREDGLPINALYSNFVKQGSYTKKDSALKYGDGRVIKRNFDDCKQEGGSHDDDTSSSISPPDKKKRKKDKKKALKKAEKLEAKKKAKLEEKKRLKLEEKKRAKLEEKKKAKMKKKMLSVSSSPSSSDKVEDSHIVEKSNTDGDEKKKKKLKREKKNKPKKEESKSKKEKTKKKKSKS